MPTNVRLRQPVVCLGLCVGVAFGAAGEKRGRDQKKDRDQPSQDSACLEVPARALDLILGRPTRDSVTISVLAYQDTEGVIAVGTQAGHSIGQTPLRLFKKDEPVELVIGGLQPNTGYQYQLRSRGTNSAAGVFHTQRPPGSAFTFTVTADSHLDDRSSPEIYRKTLTNALADKPDFHVDLGDTFMTEKHASRDAALRQYFAQRFYFGQLCHSAPLFLVLGNHDGESPRGRGSDADDLAVWSNRMRKLYFPNPIPDRFYSGNANPHAEAGLLQNYYAWEWGDALFVVLDPFWFTQKQRGRDDNWKRTVGEEQYQWLERTLSESRAIFKFVFTHHLVGGGTPEGRGGVEAASSYEWGGKNADGTDGFNQNRSGWSMPIHELLVRNRVAIVFHGHDHFYAKQDLDGIVYQLVPQPANESSSRAPRFAAEYGYRDGALLGGSGHIRIAVSETGIRADYVLSDGSIAHTYAVPAAR